MLDEEMLQDAEDDARCVAFIQNVLPQDLKEKFDEDTLYYFIDVLCDYYFEHSDEFEAQADADGSIDIDIDAVAEHLCQMARKDKMGEFDPDEVRFVVEAELDYAEQEEE